ncbi:MBL fold metallo-hydrolase [Flavicella marina]|uniref:MBL fold metallo-hydrolase n=1 Tax=Flavicella marina TaxID=1475951 RepID=UPI001D0286F1|nr:MBL fold metallo-hydrolase [Flavicella marina]
MFKKLIKKGMILFVAILVSLIGVYMLFVSFYPSFGGDVSKEDQELYKTSKQFRNGVFNNSNDVPKELSFSETMKLAFTFFTTKVPNGRPKTDINVTKIDSSEVANYKGEAKLVWFGHSSFLLQLEGRNILLDPMFGEVAAPHPLLGAPRFNKEFPLAVDKLPQIDAVLFSHDHYDHLDYKTINAIKHKTKHFYVPLGVGVHLKSWGVPEDSITELDWWQETQFETLTFVCTPAQHFSGRKLNNNKSTLWASWVIQSQNENIYFSGDSGYANHFKEIGEKYGPFDMALMECGQYNEKWSDIHMMPEETAQAGVDVKAKKIMPIHWGGFKLALHDWTDPVNRVSAKAKELSLPIVTPEIGQEIFVKDSMVVAKKWWENY